MKINIIDRPSVNFTDEEITPRYIVIHCIGYDDIKALDILTKTVENGGGGVSSHYFIPQVQDTTLDGYPIYNLVSDNKKAWHAGASKWYQDENLNSFSIGIEFNSPNYANAITGDGNLDWYHFDGFQQDQIQAGVELIKTLMNKYNIPKENVIGHFDIAPWRLDKDGNAILGKTDPGAKFPWKLLAKEGIGVWPKEERTREDEIDLSLKNVQKLLADNGYKIEQTDIYDPQTEFTIKAFQIHYMPENIDGKISAQLVTSLENLTDHQYSENPIQAPDYYMLDVA
ncbi:MAG: N-acetylmuramoyl-L-alanine amidase [Sphingobacteriia bacterium]|nr:N-acetylmuramoyl-L-alanine amidase [Sphingobacteriia bacterium]